MQLWRKHPGLLRAGALLVAAAAAFLPGVFAPQGVAEVEELASDAFWRLGKDQHSERRVVLLDIDDKSLQAVGPWPWPRTTMAALSNRLAEAGVQLQGYDIAFSDLRNGDDELALAWVENRGRGRPAVFHRPWRDAPVRASRRCAQCRGLPRFRAPFVRPLRHR